MQRLHQSRSGEAHLVEGQSTVESTGARCDEGAWRCHEHQSVGRCILNFAVRNGTESTHRDICIDGEGEVRWPLARVCENYPVWVHAQSKDLLHLLG